MHKQFKALLYKKSTNSAFIAFLKSLNRYEFYLVYNSNPIRKLKTGQCIFSAFAHPFNPSFHQTSGLSFH